MSVASRKGVRTIAPLTLLACGNSIRTALAFVAPDTCTPALCSRRSTSSVVPPSASKQSVDLLSKSQRRRFPTRWTCAGSRSSRSTMSESSSLPKFSVAACQILCGEDKSANIAAAERAVKDAAAAGAQVVVLPECWNSPYDTASFPVYAEPVPHVGGEPPADKSPSTTMLCRTAAEAKIHLVGGSVPEVSDEGSVYNTCVVVDPAGKIVAKHRKVHLFDIDVPGGIRFKESDTLSPGDALTSFETPFGVVGVGICYDMRFPELSMAMRAAGAVLLCFPGAFNMTTGPAHWELLQRARAVDNQCYVVTASPARNPESKYQAWGHSSVIDPWGAVVATSEHDSAMVVAEIDVNRVMEVRRSIPVSLQKRSDLYRLEVP